MNSITISPREAKFSRIMSHLSRKGCQVHRNGCEAQQKYTRYSSGVHAESPMTENVGKWRSVWPNSSSGLLPKTRKTGMRVLIFKYYGSGDHSCRPQTNARKRFRYRSRTEGQNVIAPHALQDIVGLIFQSQKGRYNRISTPRHNPVQPTTVKPTMR